LRIKDTFTVDDGMPRSIFHNKYARKTDDGYESWAAVAARVVAGNLSLAPDTEPDGQELLRLAQAGVMPFAGRHLQHGDLEQANKRGELFTNCSTAMFSFVKFWLMMKGSGVGRLYDSDLCRVNWDNLPECRFVLSQSHADYEPHIEALEDAERLYDSEGENVRWFVVEDSTEGLTKVIEIMETAAFQERHRHKMFIFDFSNLRIKGTPISGQQGRPSSGPLPFIDAFLKIARVRGAGMALWMQAMYVDHYSSASVQLGGIRRAARIAVRSWRQRDIFEFINIKRGGFLWSANNSVAVDAEFWEQARSPKPSHARRVFEAVTAAAYYDGTGEPAFLNVDQFNWLPDGADTLDVSGLFQGLDVHPNTLRMAEKHLKAALKKKNPYLVNPCVTGDTWIDTTEGPRKVSDLVGVPFHALVAGEAHFCAKGFFSTGEQEVYRIYRNKEAILTATANHEVLTDQGFVEVQDLYPAHSVLVVGELKESILLEPKQEMSPIAYPEGSPLAAFDVSRRNSWDKYQDKAKAALRETGYVVGMNVKPAGVAEVFDCTIEGVHRYVSNGLVSHNCGEIVLAAWGGYCVIGDINLAEATIDEAMTACKLMPRFLMRANKMKFLYQAEVDRTNRIGVGLTGIHEFAWHQFGLTFGDLLDLKKSADFWALLNRMREIAHISAAAYAERLGVAVPHTVTTIKPSGTISKVMNVTEGAHLPAYAHYLRWVQFNEDDPAVVDLVQRGYPIERDLKEYKHTVIIGFPTALPIVDAMGDKIVLAGEATVEQQFEWLRLLEQHWIGEGGNQISFTLKYDPANMTFEEYRVLLLEHMPTVKACSFMPQTDMSAYSYQPEEAIDKEEFNRLMLHIERVEREGYDSGALACAGGACPIEHDIN